MKTKIKEEKLFKAIQKTTNVVQKKINRDSFDPTLIISETFFYEIPVFFVITDEPKHT